MRMAVQRKDHHSVTIHAISSQEWRCENASNQITQKRAHVDANDFTSWIHLESSPIEAHKPRSTGRPREGERHKFKHRSQPMNSELHKRRQTASIKQFHAERDGERGACDGERARYGARDGDRGARDGERGARTRRRAWRT